MSVALQAWAMGMGCVLVLTLPMLAWRDPMRLSKRDETVLARVALLAPVWPVVILWGAWALSRYLTDTARRPLR